MSVWGRHFYHLTQSSLSLDRGSLGTVPWHTKTLGIGMETKVVQQSGGEATLRGAGRCVVQEVRQGQERAVAPADLHSSLLSLSFFLFVIDAHLARATGADLDGAVHPLIVARVQRLDDGLGIGVLLDAASGHLRLDCASREDALLAFEAFHAHALRERLVAGLDGHDDVRAALSVFLVYADEHGGAAVNVFGSVFIFVQLYRVIDHLPNLSVAPPPYSLDFPQLLTPLSPLLTFLFSLVSSIFA